MLCFLLTKAFVKYQGGFLSLIDKKLMKGNDKMYNVNFAVIWLFDLKNIEST